MSQVVAVREVRSIDHRGRAWGAQCTGIKRSGERCRKFAIRGGSVCQKHGGQLPVVRAAANAHLRSLAPKAVSVLEAALTMDGSPDLVQLRAAQTVLRLNGISDTAPARARGRMSSAHRALEAGPLQGAELDGEIEELLAVVGESKPRELSAGEDSQPEV